MANTELFNNVFRGKALKVTLIPAIDTLVTSRHDDPSYDIELDDVPVARGVSANEALVKLCRLMVLLKEN